MPLQDGIHLIIMNIPFIAFFYALAYDKAACFSFPFPLYNKSLVSAFEVDVFSQSIWRSSDKMSFLPFCLRRSGSP